MSSSNRPHRPPEPDIVSLYYKHKKSNVEFGPSKKWLDLLEEQIIIFLGRMFCLKNFDKPTKSSKYLEGCLELKSVKDTNVALFTIAQLVNMLSEDLLYEVLPMMSNLIFMTKHNYNFCNARVKTGNAKKVVLKFQQMIASPTYLASANPHARFTKLIDVVNSIRKYSEYLLRISGYSRNMGRSPREILRDIHQVRSRSTIWIVQVQVIPTSTNTSPICILNPSSDQISLKC